MRKVNCAMSYVLCGDRVLTAKLICIGNNVWIGESVIILLGVTIGEGSVIGVRACVTKSTLAYSIVVKKSAKVIKTYNCETKCLERIE